MNFPTLVLPFACVTIVGLLLAPILHRVRPLCAARVAYMAMVAVATAGFPVGVYFVFSLFAQLPVIGSSIHDFFHTRGVHSSASTWWAVVGGFWMLTAIGRSLVLLYSRRLIARACTASGETVVETPGVFAYTLPGSTGSIVLSRELTEVLTGPELQVVVAHERAHARLRHDRARVVGQICAVFVPILIPLFHRLEFSLERIADESAAAACGSRRLVAQTLAKVALDSQVPRMALGIAGTDVVARVQALDNAPNESPPTEGFSSVVLVSVIAALVVVQWQQVAAVVQMICGA